MSQTYGIEAPEDDHRGQSLRPPARYLIVMDTPEQATALLFAEDRGRVGEFAAASEEVAVMTRGLVPSAGAEDAAWDAALGGFDVAQRRSAEVYTLDV